MLEQSLKPANLRGREDRGQPIDRREDVCLMRMFGEDWFKLSEVESS